MIKEELPALRDETPIVLSRRSSGFFIRLFAIRENANLLTFPPIIKREPPFSRLRITCSVTPYAS